MKLKFLCLLAGAILIACLQRHSERQEHTAATGVFDLHSRPATTPMYSKFVADSFKIFSSLPLKYGQDTTSSYPLILLLDANAYFESVVAELKLGTLTEGFPAAVVVGIGYKDFQTLDSLRDRDYTFPAALPADDFKTSGGGAKFKKFIDLELLPHLLQEYKINPEKIILMGHSLGGYFTLYYLLDGLENGQFKIQNFVAASPSLSYANRYLSALEKKHAATQQKFPVRLYVSAGTLEQDASDHENLFRLFKNQMESHQDNKMKVKFIEFGNFDHMDAAMPGFMKGLSFIFQK